MINNTKSWIKQYNEQEAKPTIGVDEVGRGPLAGPVVAAAVVPHSNTDHLHIRDSKTLSENKITLIASQIRETSYYGIGLATVQEIEEINILQATMLAMRRAIEQLITIHKDQLFENHTIHVDGNCNPLPSHHNIKLLIKGDSRCRSIAAASIIAKDYRDTLMRKSHEQYPQYQWYKNKGYGTAAHIAAIKSFGPSPLHRTSWLKMIIRM